MLTNYFVDPGGGSDVTGDGTIGTPWATVQHALDTITRDTTNGDQINLKSGTADVLAATLDLTTYGTPTATAPLVLRGYTSAANDGGMGEIDCGGATMWASASYDYLILADLEMHTFGDNTGLDLDNNLILYRCEIHKGASTPSNKNLVNIDSDCQVIGCYIHDTGSSNVAALDLNSFGNVFGNYIVPGADNSGGCISGGNDYAIVGNILVCDHTGARGIIAGFSGFNGLVMHNIVYNSAAGTGSGVVIANQTAGYSPVMNNIICGWSGAGGEGVLASADLGLAGWNAFYNCTANYTITGNQIIDLTANDVALAADPFTDAANGDFSLTTAAKTALASKGWPTSYLGAHANTVSNLNIGPIQMAAGGGGASIYRRVARLLGG
jgi:hypothetical protein